MIHTGKHLSRRTLLRGMGVSIALPLLDAMTPALASTTKKPTTPLRLGFVYIPNGVTFPEWKPARTGADYEFTRILKPLEKFREHMFVLSGLDHHQANALGDGGGDHGRAGACYLTGVHPKKTAGADIQAGISADQIAAREAGNQTRVASLELSCEDSRTVGNCDSGYSCAYTNSISWRGPSTPMAPETNPRIVFERLFGDEDLTLAPETRARRAALRKSILDVVGERTGRLVGTLGPSDRRKIDEYLTAVRELEKRIERAEKGSRDFTPDMEKPAGIPVEFTEYAKLMYDLLVLAYQADVTRITTFMIGREGSVRTYPQVGVNDPHHPMTHHRNLPEMIEKVTRINVFHTQLFSYFLERLRSTREGDGNLLDRSMIVYGSCICDGNSHSHVNLPVLLLGKGNGKLKPGRHIEYAKGTPMTNLFLSLLEKMDVHPEKIGDSTGKLEMLSGL